VENPKQGKKGVTHKFIIIERLQEEEEDITTALYNSSHSFVMLTIYIPNYCASLL